MALVLPSWSCGVWRISNLLRNSVNSMCSGNPVNIKNMYVDWETPVCRAQFLVDPHWWFLGHTAVAEMKESRDIMIRDGPFDLNCERSYGFETSHICFVRQVIMTPIEQRVWQHRKFSLILPFWKSEQKILACTNTRVPCREHLQRKNIKKKQQHVEGPLNPSRVCNVPDFTQDRGKHDLKSILQPRDSTQNTTVK